MPIIPCLSHRLTPHTPYEPTASFRVRPLSSGWVLCRDRDGAVLGLFSSAEGAHRAGRTCDCNTHVRGPVTRARGERVAEL